MSDVTDLAGLSDAMFEDGDAGDFLDDFVSRATVEDARFAEGLADICVRQELLGALISNRKKARISQKSVAAAMGTTQSAVSELEGGGKDIYVSTLQRYARAVGAHLILNVALRNAAGTITTTPSHAKVYALNWRHDGPSINSYEATIGAAKSDCA